MTNTIHPTAYVDPQAKLGENNYIGAFCHVYGNVTMGNDNHFEGYVSVGSPAEKHGNFRSVVEHGVIIGNNNTIREFVTMNAGSRRPTVLGNNCYMLRGSHLSHDTIVEDDVTISCTVMIGGESYVMTGVNLGLGSLIHQFSVIGSYSMLGMGAVVTKSLELEPGGIFVGNPAKFLKRNEVGLSRKNISLETFNAEVDRWRSIKGTNHL